MPEIWKDIPGYEGYYQASDSGNIKSLGRNISYLLNGKEVIRFQKEKILKPRVRKDKRLQVDLQKNKNKTSNNIHKLIALAFLGVRPEGKEVAHEDGNCQNNKLRNLRYATSQENEEDKIRHGTKVFGEKVKGAKLSDEECLEIFLSNERNIRLAEKYKVSDVTISNIKLKKTRKHLHERPY